MGVVRIQAIGPGAVEYLLHGCDPKQPEAGQELEAGQEPEVDGAELGPGQEPQAEAGVGYFLDERGEPAGQWLGSGMVGLGLSYRAGDTAGEDDLRAIFGELRYPGSQRPGSTQENPLFLGAKPRAYQTLAERVEAALKAEPDASPERQREIEVQTARNSKSNTAYYDATFSPVKSVSVYYAALVAAGETQLAAQVREAHDQAVRIAIESAEADVAWAKTGRHGRASESGRTTGAWEKATGFSAVLFAHHTNRDGEPQLHAHVAVLNRVALADGRVYALDGAAFRPVKDAMAAAYDRAMEAILSDLTGVVWVERADGLGREIAGIDPALMEEASTRTREHVEPRIEELVAAYQERHGYEPGPQARRKIVDQAVKDTRRPKTGPAGPAAVAAWVAGAEGRAERLTAALDEVDQAVGVATANGHPDPMATGYVTGPEMAGGREVVAGGQEVVAGGQSPVAAGHEPVADGQAVSGGMAGGQNAVAGGQGVMGSDARAAMGDRAVAAGLERVQAKYPSWSIGALYREIDHALGANAGAAGLGIAERRDWVWELARGAITPGADSRVVQVSMGDPVPIPDELRREVDGRSRFRAPIDERYVTAAHLGMEERLAATAQAPTAPSLPAGTVGRVADEARRAGLSGDQVQAVATILSSPRQVEVLVGPAGAGKSHTLAQLARAWQSEHGGRVIGTAAAEVATRNLRELGVDAADDATRNLAELGFQAVNTTRLLNKLEPDEQGRVKFTLRANDLLVVDEAGMVSTNDLDRLTTLAARAGAKVIWAGDHHQLPSVEAGGMFAHLAEKPAAVELETVHRFSNQWERDASLRLRAGDASVAPVYANEGRLRAGTLEQMEYLATRDYLADRLAGVSGLLIVGSNQRAEQLSSDIQSQLAELGLVGTHKLADLRDQTELRMGDLIQARKGNASLRVDAPPDANGRRGAAMPVANRQMFTVVGYDPATGTVYGRDEHGAVAHLTEDYVASQVTLAYAVTNHAAQGVTVDRARALAERGMTAEALYPASTRGRHLNVIYLQTEIDPDPHAPQRERDTAVAALVRTLENDAGELTDAAITVAQSAALEARSMLTLAEYYDRIAAEQGHTRHAGIAVAEFGAGVKSEDAFGALLGKMRAVELEGHDITAIVAEAKAMAGFRDAREVSKVMHWRLGVLEDKRTPEHSREEVVDGHRSVRPAWSQLAEQHRERVAETGDAVEGVLAAVAERAQDRTQELGAQTAAAPPAWAIEWLGPLPDPASEAVAHAEWVRGAGQVAAYREWRGIPDEQISIGAAPPPAQQLAHELWTRAAETGAGDPQVIDWRKASDHEVREAMQRWSREQQLGPLPVAEERGEAIALAHDATNDATVGRAQLEVMDLDDPNRARLVSRIHTYEVMAEQALGFAASLDDAHATREAWWEQTREVREAAHAAESELERRGLSRYDEPDPQPTPDRPTPQVERSPEAGLAGEPAHAVEEAEVGVDNEADLRGDRAQRGEQGTLELDLDQAQPDLEAAAGPQQEAEPVAPTGEVDTAPAGSASHQRFLDKLAVEHQQALDEVDPAGQMDPVARESALRARNFERFTDELRTAHGSRLDPDRQLSDLDLAQARARELAEDPAQTTTRRADTEAAPQRETGEPRRDEPQVAATTEGGPKRVVTTEPEQASEVPARPETEMAPRNEVEPAEEVEPVSEVEDGPARMQRAAREARIARAEREAAEAIQARAAAQERSAEQGPEVGKRAGVVAEFDREATVDDELASHREAQQAMRGERDLQRQLERDGGLEVDDD